ncbi:uncharacterized protein LOC123665778 [Melitaea cinxia]|uniref:uncharacterized protein LOC123665778 n=1 Tax=Melitaea cinxia TaxID=113334 RepID=UPI001E273485|nr:uncharacterized protein LOC123665778 [Melitaea cinxia]
MASPTVEQNRLLSALEDVANMIQKAQTNIKKCPKQRLTEGYIKTRLKTIDEYWETFKETHKNLLKCTPREQRGVLPYFLNEEYYSYEDLYICLKGDLTDLLSNMDSKPKIFEESNSSNLLQNAQSSFAKLPRIQLPTFSGKYEDWPTYQDLFLALVHNTTINDVQKLHYLKTSVTGEAEMLLRHIKITQDNYKGAWELLKTRFGNKKMIVFSILKRLFGQKKVSHQLAYQIKNLLDTTTECISSLKNLNICTDTWDPILIFIVGQKLDLESLKEWEEYSYKKNSDEMPSWEDFKNFLESKFRTLELIAPISTVRDKPQTSKSFHVTNRDHEIHQTQHPNTHIQPSCSYCKGGHYIYNCKDFAKQPIEQRFEIVKKNHLCFNCLIPNHNVYNCKHKTTCRICRRKHHSLLHRVKETSEEQDTQPEQIITTAHFSKQQPGHEVLLATAQVEVKSRDGDTHLLRALIDQGSEASFVSARVIELLGLKRISINGEVSGVGEETRIPIKHLTYLSVASRFNSSEVITVKAYVLKAISTRLPSKNILMNWQELQKINLADPNYYKPGSIDILLGAEVFSKIIEDGLIKMPDGIVAQKTCLGWILSGQREKEFMKNQHNVITLHIRSMVTEDNNILKKFWEIDNELYKKKKILTNEEEKCEEIYKNTTKRDEYGRYIVHLPLKQSIEDTVQLCGDTIQGAINRFKQLERKFQRNETLKEEYLKVIREYIAMGHMIRSETTDKNFIYLPHHAVIREDKDTTKVRVVYDASASGSNGKSLNDAMMVGPVLQPDLRSLITTWRTYKICVVGDIVKMYRMINITGVHTNLQRIVWRDSPDKDLESYNLTTVTFGTAAAPYLAVRTLHQLADDEAKEYPHSAPVIKRSFYMDDLMTGSDSEEKTKKKCEEIRMILRKGGFIMQKWCSNSEEVLRYLQGGEKKINDTVEIKLDKVIKILGLTWDRKEDIFKITVNLPEMIHPVTKRSILSDVARLFDPFGWLSPVVITAKIWIQKLWLCNLGWDDKLPLHMCEDWIRYREELTHLQNIQIPRWLKTTKNNFNTVELHGFADASTQAYAAVTYLKIVDGDEVHTMILASRTKVAPLKQLSVPRLELCAAALLAELMYDLAELLKINKDNIFAWTDSMVVLSWLQAQPSRWRTFVANRVSDILRVLDNDRWRHIKSTDNPADIATRGLRAYELENYNIWWSGPEWLKKNKKFLERRDDIPQTELEMKGCLHTKIEDEEKPIWERFSSLSRMKRVLAYCRRFLRKGKIEERQSYLTVNELERVLEDSIRYYQNLIYEEEIDDLKRKGIVKSRSSLITLSPFLDKKSLIRVGGRLQNASMPETFKHPIIIPANQHITKLLIMEAHIRTLHGGIQQMMAFLRTKYWIIGLKSAVRNCIRNCKVCIIDKAKVKHQLMGQLPLTRVNAYRPFFNSGVDYAGPVMLRTSKGRGHHATKGYICLFVCMSTRAIHLEAVTDLTSQAFIAAFRRFVARRGRCAHLMSDNGTNFVGAAKELKELFTKTMNNVTKEVAELLANDGTTWHFIPPRMPSYGGLWEAGIQSAKRHLTRINRDTKLTYEEMATLLAQVEACLNSRPLCQIDKSTDTILTPGHFLVGEPLISVPDTNYEERNISLMSRWHLIQKMTKDFWQRWKTEYLNTLQQRYKWQTKVPSPAVGDLVIVKDENTPPTKWLLAKVKHLHPGADDLVRVLTVQTPGNHELKRPLSKLILLPKDKDYN